MDESTRRRLLPLLTVAIVAASVLCVWLAVTKPGADTIESATPPRVSAGTYLPADLARPAGDAVAAAVLEVPDTLTYDYRDLKGSLHTATKGMTAPFAKRFSRTFSRTAAPLARRERTVTDAKAVAAGVVRVVDDSHVRCLLYVDQRMASATKAGAKPRLLTVNHSRIAVDMVLRDGTWMLDGISPV